MISRRRIVKAGAMGIAMVTLPFDRIPRAFSQSASAFDYYISPTGDDNNPGTLSSPWSITALNSKKSIYAGKKVGMIAGTYQHGTVGGVQTTLYSIYQAFSSTTGNWSVLALQGGPSGSQPTYIASCDSSGSYSARAAIIDCSNPSNRALPTASGSVLGQYSYMGSNVSQYGNATVDGIVIRNFTFCALIFQGVSSGNYSGLTIKNCELYDGQNIVSNNNPGAIWIEFSNNAVVTNCKIHDLKSNGAGGSFSNQLMGFIQFNSYGTEITNCTFYNCSAVSNKDGQQSLNVSYCYLGWGTFGSGWDRGLWSPTEYGATVQNYLCGAGASVNFHHNILVGPIFGFNESSNNPNAGTINMYNNTFYQPPITSASPMWVFDGYGNGSDGTPTGTWNFYNNIVYAANGTYESGAFSSSGLTLPSATASRSTAGTIDHNCYGIGMTFNPVETYSNRVNVATWQGYGFDTHSKTLTTTPFSGTPTEGAYQSFAITGSATTAGMGGASCGAVDGTGLVGCDFAGELVPVPPTLILG